MKMKKKKLLRQLETERLAQRIATAAHEESAKMLSRERHQRRELRDTLDALTAQLEVAKNERDVFHRSTSQLLEAAKDHDAEMDKSKRETFEVEQKCRELERQLATVREKQKKQRPASECPKCGHTHLNEDVCGFHSCTCVQKTGGEECKTTN
jgi:uncharacterized protein YigA (DUF484 family)